MARYRAFIAAILSAAALVAPGGVTEAAEQTPDVRFDGVLRLEWRFSPSWVDRLQPTSNLVTTNKLTNASNLAAALVLNFREPLDKDLTAFARVGAETTGNPRITSFDAAHYFTGSAVKESAEVDQFGFVWKNKQTTAKIGRQDLSVGATGLLYDTTAYIGDTSIDAIRVKGNTDKLAWDAVAAKQLEEAAKGNQLFVLSASYKFSKQLTIGLTGARQKLSSTGTMIHYRDVSVEYQLNAKLVLLSDMINSDDRRNLSPLLPQLTKDPSGEGVLAEYSFDRRNAIRVGWWKLNYGADISNRTAATIASSGWAFFLRHRLDKTSLVELNYGFKTFNVLDKPVERGIRVTYCLSF